MVEQSVSADYGLIGYPLSHSQSKSFFSRLFDETGSDESYGNFAMPVLSESSLNEVLAKNPRLKGFNVTAPHKIAIMSYLDRISAEAERIGAVNTVKIYRAEDGHIVSLEGHNTDVEGFYESVRPLVEFLACKGALILGTGGASKAVAEALRRLDIVALFVSRSKVAESVITYDDITADVLKDYPLIINATPLGTYPDISGYPPFPYELLTEHNLCHDLVYNPSETEFMRRSAAYGAVVKNGLDMLYRQAIASLKIWKAQ
ncbi:MAG: shikimate dehydrogenase [Muribaculaceae bacterium]|nr:shikimate dehydrogenase [Muribaculaceae bacterium]